MVTQMSQHTVNPQYIQVFFGRCSVPALPIGEVEARANLDLLRTIGPDIADLLFRLRLAASQMGANTVVNAIYEIDISPNGWQGFAISGTAAVTLLAGQCSPEGNDTASRIEFVALLTECGIITYEEYERMVASIRREAEESGTS